MSVITQVNRMYNKSLLKHTLPLLLLTNEDRFRKEILNRQETYTSVITNHFASKDSSTLNALKRFRLSSPRNVIFFHLNMNSIWLLLMEFDNLQEIINGNVDVLAVAETKINTYFSSAQFCLEGYHRPRGLYRSHKNRGILVYVRSSLPSRKLEYSNIPFGI